MKRCELPVLVMHSWEHPKVNQLKSTDEVSISAGVEDKRSESNGCADRPSGGATRLSAIEASQH